MTIHATTTLIPAEILDFGIAKMIEEGTGATGTGQILGTPKYMAPEQATAQVPVTPATDRCALGLVAYRLLMGDSYYQGGAIAILAQLLHGDLQAPSERGSRLGPAFDAWFSKACHRDPSRRFASAREQIEALADALAVPGEVGDQDRLMAAPPPRVETENEAERPRAPATAAGRSPILIASLFAGGLTAVLMVGVFVARRIAAPSSQRPPAEASRPSVADSDPNPWASWRRNTALWGSGSEDVWVGGNSAASRTGTLSHWDGKTWTGAAGGPFPAIWNLWGAGPGDLWAVADGGSVLHHTSAGWTMHRAPADFRAALVGIWGSGGRDIWVVGASGAVLHWNGTAWSDVDAGFESHTLFGVWGSGPHDVWVVGDKGAIRHWDGNTWSTFPSGVAADLIDIWGDGPSNVWVVGFAGTILHWNGTNWACSEKTDRNVMSVWGSGPNDVWAGGDGGALLHWDGVSWTPVPSGTTQTLNEIWGTGRDDVWAVGENGTVLRWDGRRWSVGPR